MLKFVVEDFYLLVVLMVVGVVAGAAIAGMPIVSDITWFFVSIFKSLP